MKKIKHRLFDKRSVCENDEEYNNFEFLIEKIGYLIIGNWGELVEVEKSEKLIVEELEKFVFKKMINMNGANSKQMEKYAHQIVKKIYDQPCHYCKRYRDGVR